MQRRFIVGILFAAIASAVFTAELPGQETAKLFRVSTNVPEARKEFEAGYFEFREGMIGRARTRLTRALSLDSTLAVARVLHARVGTWPNAATRQAEFDRAVRDAASASPEELLFTVAWREWTVGRREAGNAAWTALAELTPDDPSVLEELPAILIAKGRRPDAVQEAKRLVAQYPAYARLYSVLAYTILSVEADTAAALKALEQYPLHASESPHAHLRLARSAASWDHWEYAEKHYQRVVDLDSAFVYGYFGLADVALGKGDVATAQQQLERAIRHETELAERSRFARYRAHLFLLLNKPDRTLTELQSLAEVEQRDGRTNVAASILMEAAGIDAVLGSGRNVDALLRRARQTANVNLLNYFAWAGTAYAFSKRLEDARQAADSLEQTARQQRSNYMGGAIVQMLRGMERYAAGDQVKALEHLAKSDSQYVLVEMTRALTLAKSGKRKEADEVRNRVIAWTKYQPYSAADAIARAVMTSFR